jgi:putative oxidoreductase
MNVRGRAVGDILPLVCRAVVVLIVAVPAARKFYAYSDRVAQFDAWGIPLPEVAVLAAGTVQVIALLTILLGVGGRFGAAALAVVMTVAMAAAGLDPFNGAVFAAAVVIAVLGTGPYSYWDPSVSALRSADWGRVTATN